MHTKMENVENPENFVFAFYDGKLFHTFSHYFMLLSLYGLFMFYVSLGEGRRRVARASLRCHSMECLYELRQYMQIIEIFGVNVVCLPVMFIVFVH